MTAIEELESTERDELVRLVADFLGVRDRSAVAGAVSDFDVRRLRAGEVLLSEGDPAGSAFLVVSGRLAAVRQAEDGDEHELARFGRGQLIGEAGLLDQSTRSATVLAVRDSVVAELTTDAFHTLVARHPGVMGQVVRQLVQRASAPMGRSRRATSTIALGSSAAAVNTRVVATQFMQALERFGRIGHVTAGRTDADLGQPGIAQSLEGDPDAPRLRAYLHQIELEHDYLIIEYGREPDGWNRTALAMADRIVLFVSPEPDRQEREAVARILADAPTRTTVIAAVAHPQGTERPAATATLRRDLGVDEILHAREGSRADVERVARIAASQAVGLVLGGGGARGFAHIGVYQALVELDVPIDVVAGASIGAPLGGAIACGLSPAEMRPAVKRLFTDLLDYTIPVVSLIKAERITRAIDEQFSDWDIDDLWLPFRCVSTNLTRSWTEVHRHGPSATAIRASVAIPGVMPPVPDGDDLLVDGGVLNNLPVDVLADDGICSTIIAVDVAPPVGPRAHSDYGLSVSGWSALRQSLGRGRSSYPGITAVLMRSMLVGAMRDRDRVIDESGVDLLLELPLKRVGLLEFDAVDPVADQGHELAKPMIEAWLTDRGGWSGRP